jgi:hypothetical protein
MDKFYEDDILYRFNEVLAKRKKDIAIIRKYKFNSKFRGKNYQVLKSKKENNILGQ